MSQDNTNIPAGDGGEQPRRRGRQAARRARRQRRGRKPEVRPGGAVEALYDPHRLARLVRDRWGTDAEKRLTLRYWGRGWWRYENGCYRLLDVDDLGAAVTDEVKREFDTRPVLDSYGRVRQVTRSLVGNVVNALGSLPDIRLSKEIVQPAWLGAKPTEREYLAVKNGLVDVKVFQQHKRNVLRAHTPEWFTPACLPYAYEPTAKSPRWTAFLDWMFKGSIELVQLVQEWFGYCLVIDSSLQKFVIAEGEGSNGKSVLLDMLRFVVGQENCSSVALEDFTGKFDLSMTVGKLVNVVAEVGDVARLPEGKLKAFVAGDLMTFDRKHRQPLQVNPTARLVFATNKLPKFGDRSEGMWRRLIVLPCDAVVAPEQQDTELAKKLCEELPGILNWALNGLARLRKRGRFQIPEASRKAVHAHRQDSQPELQFFEDHCEAGPKAEVDCGALYLAYSGWCVENYHEVMNAKLFGKALRKQFPSVDRARRRRDGKPVWVYTRVQLIP